MDLERGISDISQSSAPRDEPANSSKRKVRLPSEPELDSFAPMATTSSRLSNQKMPRPGFRSRSSTLRTKGVRQNSIFEINGDTHPKFYRFDPDMTLDQLVLVLPSEGQQLFKTLDLELDKVSKFYGEREVDAKTRFQELGSQWKELEDHKREFQAFRKRGGGIKGAPKFLRPAVSMLPQPTGSPRGGSVSPPDLHEQEGTPPQSRYRHGRPEAYGQAKSALKLASESSLSFTLILSISVRMLITRACSSVPAFEVRFTIEAYL